MWYLPALSGGGERVEVSLSWCWRLESGLLIGATGGISLRWRIVVGYRNTDTVSIRNSLSVRIGCTSCMPDGDVGDVFLCAIPAIMAVGGMVLRWMS